MKNLIKKILGYLSENQSLPTRFENKTSKTILTANAHVTLNSETEIKEKSKETEKKKELVKNKVTEIVKESDLKVEYLFKFIEKSGTKIYRLNFADKFLNIIGEDEGLITPLEGFKALYVNLLIKKGISFKTKPCFIMRNGVIDTLFMLHHFYRWYSLKSGLSGFEYRSQQLFKRYLKDVNAKSLNTLELNDIVSLQEAVQRDKEATEFVISIARDKQGAKNVRNKIANEGGANI